MDDKINPYNKEYFGKGVIQTWQNIINVLADVMHVPASLIMRINSENIEVFLSSETEGNPYKVGDKEKFINNGCYCEWVVKNQKKLLVPNALIDPLWENNPNIKLNMISYLGFPIHLADGVIFGTLCVYDNKENHFNEAYISLMQEFCVAIEAQIKLEFVNNLVINISKIYPICSYCKKVRNKDGNWESVEAYINNISGNDATHSICPDCAEKAMLEFKDNTSKIQFSYPT